MNASRGFGGAGWRARSLRTPRGVAMIMTLVVMGSLLLGGLVATGMRMATLRGAGQTLIGTQSYSCAEAGIVAARNYLRANPANWANNTGAGSYLNNAAWTQAPGFPTAAGLPVASPGYQVTISNDIDQFPVPTPTADHNGTIILNSTCVDGYGASAGTLNNPMKVTRYLTIMPLVNTGTTNFNPGAVTYTTTADLTGGAGTNAQGGINGYSGSVAGSGSGPGGSQVAALYTSSGISADGVTLVNNQIALAGQADTYQFIWIANSSEGTVSKIDTVLYKEVARYATGPGGGIPQTTAVDLQGNAWVANTANNTITKIGLLEKGNCVDRNGDGVITTAVSPASGPATALPWTGSWGTVTGAVDECILGNIPLTWGGVNTPTGITALAIDPNNNILAGSPKPNSALFKISTTASPTTAAIAGAINTVQGVYSAIVDSSGYLWATDATSTTILKVNTNPLSALGTVSVGFPAYAIAIDPAQRLWVDSCGSQSIARVTTPDTAPTVATYTRAYSANAQTNAGKQCAGGLTVDASNNVWIAGSAYDNIVDRYDQNGNSLARITVGKGPTGVAVDAAGQVWTPNNGDNTASRISPTMNAVPLTALPVGLGPFDTGDMTGTMARGTTVRVGTWSVRQNCGLGCTSWQGVSWNPAGTPPIGTSITVQARFANSVAELALSPWVPVSNSALGSGNWWAQGAHVGSIIEVVFTLTSNSLVTTPVVTDVTITPWLAWSPPAATPSWSTSFETGQPQGLSNAILYAQNETGATCVQESTTTHTGATAFQLSATATAPYSYVYCELYASPGFTITSGMKMRYWIYHTWVGSAAVDGLLSGGQDLRDFNSQIIKDTAGVPIHPSWRQDLMGQWDYVQVDLSPAVGQTFQYLMLAYDTGLGFPSSNYTGPITVVLDDLSFGQ